MPLLGQKIYLAQAEEKRTKKGKGKFEIPFTNEVFTSKEEYDQQMQAYKQPIWSCQCTGFTGLTYEDALRSETEVHKRLSTKFPKHLERPVLQLVHHRAAPLDVIVDEAQQRIQTVFGLGEIVELKVKLRGKVVSGKVVDVKEMSDDELPTSDKENSVSEDHPYSSPQSHNKQNKSTSFQYNIHVEKEDKIIHSIPGKDLLHTSTLPSRDLLQLFIRASAVQAGIMPASPWVVSDELVKKFDLPNQINEVTLSPYKVMPSSLGNLTSIKRSAEPHEMANKAKKRKLAENNSPSSGPKLKQASLLDFGKKDNMVLSVVLQRDQNTSNIGWNQTALVTPTKHNPNILASPEKVHLDHSYSSPPPHLKSETKTSPKRQKERSSPKKTEKEQKKKEKKAPTTKKGRSSDDKKQSSKRSRSKAHSKKAAKKTDNKQDSESEDVLVIDDEDISKSAKSSRSRKGDSKDDDVIIVDDSPGRNEKSSDESEKTQKKKLPTKRKLTDHFKSVPGSSPGKSPSKVSKKETPSKGKVLKSPAKGKTAKPSKQSKSPKRPSLKADDKDESSSSEEDDFEDDKKKSKKQPVGKTKKQPAKKTPQKKQTKQAASKKSATSKASSQKGTPKKVTPKKTKAKKVDDSKATPKKAKSKGTPNKATPKKAPAKKATPKKSTPKKATTPKKGTPKKTPKKATPKKTPKKSTPGKKTPQKTPKSGKKPFKQATLFDVGAKKGSKKEGNAVTKASPKTPKSPRQPPIANKMCRIKNKDQDLYKKLLAKAVKELTEKQINNLKPEIKEDVLLKYKERMDRLKWKTMSPEEREKILQARKEENRKKRAEERQKKMEELRKLRIEQAKRYEDQDLKLKPLPAPKLVSMPEGLPNALFGDIAMVVEFLNCYSGLLMPDDPYPITADCLMKALVYGNEGFAYLARVLVILLKTLLQDEIAEDWRELSVKLSDITVNMHTSSELLRMSLRRTDHDHVAEVNDDEQSNFSDSSFEDDDDVPYKLVEKLEACEYFELEPEEKLELLVCVCHRILGSYAIQDFMESKQKAAAKLWREKIQSLKEKNDKLKEEKQKKKEQKETERLEKEKLKEQQENGKKENLNDDKKVNGESSAENKDAKKTKPKKASKKETKAEANEAKEPSTPPEEALDLASVVKRRRVLAAKVKAEKAEQEILDRERRIKEQEIFRKQKEAETFQKNFEDGIQLAKLALRQSPVGTDRNHSRYWIFSTVIPGLFIEKGWVDKDVGFSTTQENEEETGREKHVEHTLPKVGQNLWFQYSSVKEIDTLLDALDNQGIRESALYTELKKRYDDITRMTFLSRRSADLRDSDGPKELLDSFREDMSDLELNIRQGQLGGVDNFDKWEKKLLGSSKLKDLGALIIESYQNVNPKFLQGILAPPKPKPVEIIKVEDEDEDDEEDGDTAKSIDSDTPNVSEKVQKWIEAVESAPTLSRLHVLLAVFETCVKWEKSAANAKCKICRRKKGDDSQLLLCDECNQPFHLFCLRPALSAVPKGDWKCPACAPSERRASRGRKYFGMDESSDEYESSEKEDIENETVCTVCEEDGELVPCRSCPASYHRECHDPPLKNYPRGKWKCSNCLNPSKSRRAKKANNARQRRAATRGRRQQEEESEEEESEEESSSEEEEESEEEVRRPQRGRGRGRPRKAATAARRSNRKVESESEEDEESEEEESSSEEEEEEEEDARPQRGRGRTAKRTTKTAKKSNKAVVFDSDVAEGIINKLMCYRGSVPFRTSPDRSEAPDYEEMIKIPMDLHMVKNKCSNKEYETYEEFFGDVKLIFTNAHDYYEESNYIRKQATKLEDYFLNQVKWANSDAVAIYETISEADTASSAASSTDENESVTDQRPTRRSSRR